MKFYEVLKETTLWTKGGGKKTKHSEKRNKYASVHLKAYKKAIKDGTAYGVWIHPIKGKI